MNAPSFGLILIFAGLAAFAGFGGWAIYVAGQVDGGWTGPGPIWPGVLLVALVSGLVMWFAGRSGYDDRRR